MPGEGSSSGSTMERLVSSPEVQWGNQPTRPPTTLGYPQQHARVPPTATVT